MGWGHGIAADGREIGYCVEAKCDFPACDADINRGLGYCCGSMHESANDDGCGKYFCSKHLDKWNHECDWQDCPRCEGTGKYIRPLGVSETCMLCNGTGLMSEAVKGPDRCPEGQHKWIGQQAGGDPADAVSTEWIEFCETCGMEKPGSFVISVHPKSFSDVINTSISNYRFDPEEYQRQAVERARAVESGQVEAIKPMPELVDYFKRVSQQILRDTQPGVTDKPLWIVVSPEHTQLAIDSGWLNPDHTPTQKFIDKYGDNPECLLVLIRELIQDDQPHFVSAPT